MTEGKEFNMCNVIHQIAPYQGKVTTEVLVFSCESQEDLESRLKETNKRMGEAASVIFNEVCMSGDTECLRTN